MAENAFIGRTEAPSEQEIAAALGRARPRWERLVAELAAEHGLVTREWHSYSRKSGWYLRLKRGDRNILYLSPNSGGGFTAALMLGAKALEAARQSGLPPQVLEILDSAKRYAEGTAVRLEVARAGDIASVKKLVGAKIAH